MTKTLILLALLTTTLICTWYTPKWQTHTHTHRSDKDTQPRIQRGTNTRIQRDNYTQKDTQRYIEKDIHSQSNTDTYREGYIRRYNKALYVKIIWTIIIIATYTYVYIISPQSLKATALILASTTWCAVSIIQDLQYRKLSKWQARIFYTVGLLGVLDSTDVGLSCVLFIFPLAYFVLVLLSSRVRSLSGAGDLRAHFVVSSICSVFPVVGLMVYGGVYVCSSVAYAVAVLWRRGHGVSKSVASVLPYAPFLCGVLVWLLPLVLVVNMV